MGGLFSAPKAPPINLPRPAPIPPIPQVEPETGESARRAVKRKRGFQKAIITGELAPTTQKKALLG